MSFEAVVHHDEVYDLVTVYLYERIDSRLRRGYRNNGAGLPLPHPLNFGPGDELPATARFSGRQWDAILQAARPANTAVSAEEIDKIANRVMGRISALEKMRMRR